MKFTIKKSDLSEAIKKLLPFVGRTGELTNINFIINQNELTLIAKNEQSTATKKLAVESDENFDFALNGNEINNIVDTYIKSIEFTKNENLLILKENRSKMKLITKNISETVSISAELKKIDFKILKEGILKTMDFVDDKVGTMAGINIKFLGNKLITQATNGYFGSICEFELENGIEKEFILPINIAKELINIDSDFVGIGFIGSKVVFEFDVFKIETATITGIYPKLEQIFNFPLDDSLELSQNEMLNMLKKAQNIITKDKFAADIEITKDFIKIYIANQNISLDEEIPCVYNGIDKKLKLNCELLPIVIKNCDDIINIRFSEKNPKALYFENKNNRMVLMMCS